MGPTWALSAPDGPHVGSMNLAIRVVMTASISYQYLNASQKHGNCAIVGSLKFGGKQTLVYIVYMLA